MKLNELLSPKKLFEGINAAVMQQKIYDFVLKKMKELNSDFHYTYAQELARTTDEFYSKTLDDALVAFNKADDINEVEEALTAAIKGVCEVIIEYFSDEMNHPPGYSARKLKGIDGIAAKELDDLIKKINPALKDLLK